MTTLNQRITLQRPVTGQDDIGQPLTGWEWVADLWADVRHQNGLQTIKAGAETSIVKASIRIRKRSDVSPAMRVIYQSAVYEIEAVIPQGVEWQDLICKAAA